MYICTCEDWKFSMPQIRSAGMLAHVHGQTYTGEEFDYCPWCGNMLVRDDDIVVTLSHILDHDDVRARNWGESGEDAASPIEDAIVEIGRLRIALDLAHKVLSGPPPNKGTMQKIIIADKWPEAISDGLILPCQLCGTVPHLDYLVDDEFWTSVVPPSISRGVVCLSCLDRLASDSGMDVAEHLKSIQFTGIGKTIVMLPDRAYYYGTARG